MKCNLPLLVGVTLLCCTSGCNSSRDSKDRDDVTCSNTIAVNLPSSASILPIESFDPDQQSSFSQSISLTAFDIYAQSYLQTIYFLKTSENTWMAMFSHDGLPISVKSPASGQLLVGAELSFDEQGVLLGIFPDPVYSEDLIFSDNDFVHQFRFRFDPFSTTQLDSAFEVNMLESGSCFIES